MIDYTIIIPHRNSVDLLAYCLASIPVRNDVQVIVIDDNSDAEKVDFDYFPRWKGANYECYFTKEGKGAGYCRNVGLEHAKGKWVLFVDADDYVLPCIHELFDRSANSSADIIFFRPIAVMLKDRKTPSKRASLYNRIIDEYHETGIDRSLRVNFYSPTCKFVKRDLIEKYHIRFDEIRYSNDNYFTTAIGCYANVIEVFDDVFYVITEGEGSLTSNFLNKPGELTCRAGAFYRSSIMAIQHGYKIDEETALLFARKVYDVNKLLYNCYFRMLKSYYKCSSYKLIDKIFVGYSRKHKLMCVVSSELRQICGYGKNTLNTCC